MYAWNGMLYSNDLDKVDRIAEMQKSIDPDKAAAVRSSLFRACTVCNSDSGNNICQLCQPIKAA